MPYVPALTSDNRTVIPEINYKDELEKLIKTEKAKSLQKRKPKKQFLHPIFETKKSDKIDKDDLKTIINHLSR